MDVAQIVCGADLATAAKQLVDLVRIGAGNLLDDVSVVLARKLVG